MAATSQTSRFEREGFLARGRVSAPEPFSDPPGFRSVLAARRSSTISRRTLECLRVPQALGIPGVFTNFVTGKFRIFKDVFVGLDLDSDDVPPVLRPSVQFSARSEQKANRCK